MFGNSSSSATKKANVLANGSSKLTNARGQGSTRELSQALVDALCADFKEHGAEAIAQVRQKSPAAYLRFVTGLAATKEDISDELRDMSDQELESNLKAALEAVGYIPDPARSNGTPGTD